MKRLSGLVSGLLTLLALSAAGGSTAQSIYPDRPIKLVVPNTPGGATDVAARFVGPKLSEILAQPVVVENRVAAGGVIGTNAVARAAPDGYTLIMVFDSFTTNPYLFSGVQYDVARDFAPISLVARSAQVLVVHPSVGARTLKDFLQYARSKGSTMNFATAGAGTSSRFGLELFKMTTGLDPVAVHYKGGAAALNDLLGGQVPAMMITMGVIIQHVKSGKLTPIAVTSAKRLALLPDVEAMGETFPGFEVQSWLGLLAPAETPRSVVERLNSAVHASLAKADVREKFEHLGFEIAAGTPEAFGAWIRGESAKWGRIIQERNIRID
jgi:tripartite-type tricarboxylate transporter receptor subunit TctC